MLRKLGMVLAAGALIAGCGTGAPPGNTGVLPASGPPVTSVSSPPTTESSLPESSVVSTAPTTVVVPTTTAAKPTASKTAPKTTAAKPKAAPKTTAAKKKSTAQCGADYYRNSSGACVHRPSSNPSGATAKCKDGSYSYSQHRSGTCSGHGGVKQWL
ncbi:DUF3761 domain-containing protein [Amycolatopsis jiangsuensis]|uniref:DUF3761 domain-containing protein n=1 Tax=Amycolatopsis jiangsuensis TaxID=1181879 RepID=A0A840J5G7_9PSEU|nr:DUF3761 domain-containing protein [Amycolatopsis jiangsuensis]MBB4688634.1 hypothetical protein [Amycolatopsis jiangsuensis]